MAGEHTDHEAIQAMEDFFKEIDLFAKMFLESDVWDLNKFKKEVATTWFPQFKEAFIQGKTDSTWGKNQNYAFVKWCWHNMPHFKESILKSRIMKEPENA